MFSQAADSAQLFYKLDLVKLETKISCNFIPRLAGRLSPSKISAHDYSSWYNALRHVWHVHKETPGSLKKQNKNSSHTMSCPVVIERPSWNSWGSTLTNQPEAWHQLPLLHVVQPRLEILMSHSVPKSLDCLIKRQLAVGFITAGLWVFSICNRHYYSSGFCHS